MWKVWVRQVQVLLEVAERVAHRGPKVFPGVVVEVGRVRGDRAEVFAVLAAVPPVLDAVRDAVAVRHQLVELLCVGGRCGRKCGSRVVSLRCD